MEIIKRINDTLEMHEFTDGNPFHLMVECSSISKLYMKIMEKLMEELHDVKYSILKSEIIAHPISGAVRGVLINRHDVHEDVIIIGDTLIETLYPWLFKKFNGDVVRINEWLVDNDYVVLVNRPPTISALSTIFMKPRIASVYPYGKTDDTNGCLLHNYDYTIRNEDRLGMFHDDSGELGDIEKFGVGVDDADSLGIDNIGLRTVGMNPIAMDGMGADVDGDCLLVVALYSNKALEQGRKMLPSKCFKNFADDSIRNHILEDFAFIDQ